MKWIFQMNPWFDSQELLDLVQASVSRRCRVMLEEAREVWGHLQTAEGLEALSRVYETQAYTREWEGFNWMVIRQGSYRHLFRWSLTEESGRLDYRVTDYLSDWNKFFKFEDSRDPGYVISFEWDGETIKVGDMPDLRKDGLSTLGQLAIDLHDELGLEGDPPSSRFE